MSNIIPIIGASGTYNLKAPFNTVISSVDVYTCQAIRKLTDIISEPADPFELYYVPLGISEIDYNTDLANGVCILSLQSGNGNWVYVPNSYLNSYPGVNGVKYTAMVLNVALGPLPNDEPLDHIKTMIYQLVFDNLGVRPIVRETAVSNTSVLPTESHEVLVAKRNNNGKTVKKSDAQIVRELQAQLATSNTKITELESFIKTKLQSQVP